MSDRKATSIIIKFDDGTILEAIGDDAKPIWEWIEAAEALAIVHGTAYYGPRFTKTEPAMPKNKGKIQGDAHESQAKTSQ